MTETFIGSRNKADLINERIRSVSLITALVALWFFTHPYRGIYHDARLYAVQALSHLSPDAYRNDLFFLHGSQDSYTIFSFIYAYVIRLLGLNAAAIALQITGHILWLSAAWLIARSLLKGSPAFWPFLVFAGVLSSEYGNSLFSYDEPFLTARIFSEALVLYGIAFLVKRKDVLAFIFMLIASSLHPLMAAGGIMFAFFYKAYAERKWYFLSALILLLAVFAAFLHISPFSGLIETMDEEWYRFSHTISAHAYPDNWEPEQLNSVLFDACIIGSAFLAASGTLRRFFFSALLTGVTGIFISSVGTYALRNVFIIQVQPWRALWLMHLFAYLAGSFLIFGPYSRSRFSRLLLSAYLSVWFMAPLVPFSGILAVLAFLMHFLIPIKNENELRIPHVIEKFLFLAPLVTGMIWLTFRCLYAYIQFLNTPDGMNSSRFVQEILMDTKLFLIFGFLSCRSYIAKIERRAVLSAFLFFFLLCNIGAIWMWDQRQVQEKFIEENAGTAKIFGNKIPAGSVVCWPDYSLRESSIKKIWFMLGTASYADPVQAAGTIFSKEKAMKYLQRAKRLGSLGFVDPRFREPKESDPMPKPAFSDVVQVCRDPELDYVVLNFKYPHGLVDSYYDEYSKKKYYLYDCKLISELQTNPKATPE